MLAGDFVEVFDVNFPFVAAESFLFALFELDFVRGGEFDEGGDVGGATSGLEVVFGHLGDGNASKWGVLNGDGFVFG